MEERLKLFPLLSLKEMALRKVAVLLWSDTDVLAPVSRFTSINGSRREWRTLADRVKVKVSQLELPKSLTKQVVDAVGSVHLEIKRWKTFNDGSSFCYFKNENSLPVSTKLYWTAAGRIDYRKTAKEQRWNPMGVEKNYRIVCNYCLEDRIAILWEKLPEKRKDYFSNKLNIVAGLSCQWPHILKGEQSTLDEWSRKNWSLNFNQYSFESAAKAPDKSAVEYFYQKLTPEERVASLMKCIYSVIEPIDRSLTVDERKSDIFCYLLSLISPDQQMETLKARPVPFFLCFVVKSWPDLFLENVALFWKHLPPSDYDRLQWAMAGYFRSTPYYRPQLFREFLAQSPPDFKRFFVDHETEFGHSPASAFLAAFFDLGDAESVEALFRSLDTADRAKVVFHRDVLKKIFEIVIYDDQWRWPLVEVCLREATLSRAERERLRAHFAGATEGTRTDNVVTKLRTLNDFLDDLDASADDEKRGQKRKLENSSLE